jgi:hypothetical protein
MCINIKVFDTIAGQGCGVTLEQARALLPAIDPVRVTSAVHRLSIAGAIELQRAGRTIIYHARPGAQPTDKRGRPRRIAVAPRSGTSG